MLAELVLEVRGLEVRCRRCDSRLSCFSIFSAIGGVGDGVEALDDLRKGLDNRLDALGIWIWSLS